MGKGPTTGWKRRYGSLPADEIVRRFVEDGTSGQKLAGEYKVKRAAIYAILKKAGVQNQRGWRHYPPSEVRHCSRCGKDLPLGAFGTLIRTGPGRTKKIEHRPWCRPCLAAYVKPFNERNWLNRFGLTRDQYDEMFKAQGGACAICGRVRRLNIDHSHDKNIVRGLLCHRCNTWMAALDDTKWYVKALKYAARFK